MDSDKLTKSLEELKALDEAFLPVVSFLAAAVATVAAAGELAPVAQAPGAMAIQAELLHQAELAVLAACQEIDGIQGDHGEAAGGLVFDAVEAVQDLVLGFLRTLLTTAQARAAGGR